MTADQTTPLAELAARANANEWMNAAQLVLLLLLIGIVAVLWLRLSDADRDRADLRDMMTIAKAHAQLARADAAAASENTVKAVDAATHAAEKADVIEEKVDAVKQAVTDGGSSTRLVPWVPGVSADRRQGDGG